MDGQIWSWVLSFVGLTGFYLAGKKVWWCWYVNIFNQILWLTYSLVSEQWGFLVATACYTIVFTKNAYEWTRDRDQGETISVVFTPFREWKRRFDMWRAKRRFLKKQKGWRIEYLEKAVGTTAMIPNEAREFAGSYDGSYVGKHRAEMSSSHFSFVEQWDIHKAFPCDCGLGDDHDAWGELRRGRYCNAKSTLPDYPYFCSMPAGHLEKKHGYAGVYWEDEE